LLEERRCGHTWKVLGSGTGDKSVVVGIPWASGSWAAAPRQALGVTGHAYKSTPSARTSFKTVS
jgi:hypothetical protein